MALPTILFRQHLQHLDAGRYHFGAYSVAGNRRNSVCFHENF